ncbi:unnamed protein product [Prorocentrum cordatum]|uniref:Reverse transcriptase domain-containing protein n=1 Tax=Prorocentrum cordatum TaxID=2364126 RepID=A0ABN9PDT9_9DINO|nr:unnamed protein product [Polarella glacialis]
MSAAQLPNSTAGRPFCGGRRASGAEYADGVTEAQLQDVVSRGATVSLDAEVQAAAPQTDPPELLDRGPFEENILRNLDWWDLVDVEQALLCTVRTWEGAHPSLDHSLEEAKGAVLKCAAEAGPDRERGWRLLMLFDRLLYARMPAKLRPQDVTATQWRKRVVVDRLRLFWRGDWKALWDEVHITCRANFSDEPSEDDDLKRLVARIEALGAANEWSKAHKAAVGSALLVTDPNEPDNVKGKFPPEQVRRPEPKVGNVDEHKDFWEAVGRQVQRDCKRLPRKAGPSLDGSRFEHWASSSADSDYAKHLAIAAVQFASGQAPDFVYQCARAGRLLILRKSDGGIRPLVITAALRRIALRAVTKVLNPRATAHVGEEQYAIGRSGPVESITHGIQADVLQDSERVAASLDINNAFGSMSRGVMADDVVTAFPELANLVSALYCTDTPLMWEGGDGEVQTITEQTGMDQGCPFSLLAFVVGLKRVLDRARALLRDAGLDGGVRFRAYVDDIYVTCAASRLPAVLAAFRQALDESGMTLSESKLKLWGVERNILPMDLQQYHGETLQVLGHAVERSSGQMHTLWLGDSGGSFASVTAALRANLDRLWTLHAEGGLPKQVTQARARLAAQSKPQHVLRGAAISAEQARACDAVVEHFWARLLGETGSFDAHRRVQLHLPLRHGGLSVGGVEVRADAAFLVGTLGALGELMSTVGVNTVAELRHVLPQHVEGMNSAVTSLDQKGAREQTRLWQSDQPQPVKGMQRVWTRAVQRNLHDQLLGSATQRHAAAIRSASTPEASRFLDPPGAASDKMTDATFQNRWPDGTKCGVELDDEGHHASICEIGGALVRRHDGSRDLVAARLVADLHAPVRTEQRCHHLDKLKPDGTMSEARLDIVVELEGTTFFLDVAIVDVLSTDSALERQRASRDGAAACRMEDEKRTKYPSANVVPLVIESYGRINVSGMAWLRRAYRDKPELFQSLLCALSHQQEPQDRGSG